jgi:dolichyl-diphosphooligosaccharide--protein glycosyltransferase
VGARTTYARTLHVAAIAGLHRLMTIWSPRQPLPVTASLLPVVVGVAGVVPAFAIGSTLGGPVAGAFAVALTMLDPLVLGRSIGGDNDVWNVVLPLYTFWFVLLALRASSSPGRVAWALTAGACTGLHAWTWSGWMLVHVAVAAGLVALTVLEGRRTALLLLVFCIASAVATSLTPQGGYFELPGAVVDALVPHHRPAAVPDTLWPSALGTVDELRPLDLSAMVRLVGGPIVLAGGASGVGLLLVAGGPARGAGVILALWLLAGAYAASGGVRFLLLLVPPLGIACAVAVGRASSALRREIRSAGRSYRAVATTALGIVLALAFFRAVEPGWTIAHIYRPQMNDAWWDALTHLDETAAPDAIVHGWWDFGHWVTYVADRRVANDGSSLLTHIPYWTSRALLAPTETESAGVLRMLSCGSDALPLPEGEHGAYATVRRTGRDPLAAFDIVNAVVGLNATAADRYLEAHGFTASDRADVLRTTHCAPPESYLVLTTRLVDKRTALVDVGSRDPRHPSVSLRVFDPTDRGTPFLGRWVPCEPSGPDGERTCPIETSLAGGAVRLGSFTYREDAIDRSMLAAGGADERTTAGAPGLLLVADPSGLERVMPASPAHPDLAVMIDVPNARILVGDPTFLASTLVQLLYLDGRYATRYAKIDERIAGDERVTTWRIHWPPATPSDVAPGSVH